MQETQKRPHSPVSQQQAEDNVPSKQGRVNHTGEEKASGSENPSSSGATTNLDITMATSLPGTGSGTASGGGNTQGQEVYVIPRPFTKFGKKLTTYSKSHKFMIFGLANAVLGPAGTSGSPTNRLLTTCLAEVPWQKLPLYMTQSEFDLIPSNSKVVECNVKVIFRTNRIAFETASSATNQATLNQISNLQTAVGINKLGWGLDRSFTSFADNQPMIPTGTAPPKYAAVTNGYRGMVADYYGADSIQLVPDNFGPAGFYPHHQVGSFTFLQNYYCMFMESHRNTGGWPCLAEHLEQYDSKTVNNKCLIDVTYKPLNGSIKSPADYQLIGQPFERGIVPVGTSLVNLRNATVGSGNQNSSETNVVRTRAYSGMNDIYSDIEKSQRLTKGPWGESKPQIQPSVHIGLQAVPALTTAAYLNANSPLNSWTDSQGYIEVLATCVVMENTPTHFPYATNPNTNIGNVMYVNPTNINSLTTPINGLYGNGTTLGNL